MPSAQGFCPNCGAPIAFALGSSLAKVCEFCRHTVLRTDRGLENQGRVADLAETPSLIGVGDEGSLKGRQFRVMGRAQLDWGKGPWDEYYVAFDQGAAWGWLAHAQGEWLCTEPVPDIQLPPYAELKLAGRVALGKYGTFVIAEIKSASVVSAEGELGPGVRPSLKRYYADCRATNGRFATLDYGDLSGVPEVFVGHSFPEAELAVQEGGPRQTNKVKTSTIRCPNCGGDVPKLLGDSAERLGCPYCGALSDIAEQTVIQKQDRARSAPHIPLGTKGNWEGNEYVCCAFLVRGANFEGEHYSWEEYLLWAARVGYRWLVNDPETGWHFVQPLNIAEIETSPVGLRYQGDTYRESNRSVARVEYVLGEVYWKCEVGERVEVIDFKHGAATISNERTGDEMLYSYSESTPWLKIANAFSLESRRGASTNSGSGAAGRVVLILVIAFVLLFFVIAFFSDHDDTSGTGGGVIWVPSTRSGGGTYRGGK